MVQTLLLKYVVMDIALMDKVKHVLLEPSSMEMVFMNLITALSARLDLLVLMVSLPKNVPTTFVNLELEEVQIAQTLVTVLVDIDVLRKARNQFHVKLVHSLLMVPLMNVQPVEKVISVLSQLQKLK